MEPVCRAAAAGRGRGAGRTVGGRSATAARDRQAACALPSRRYVVVRPAARSGAARADRRAAVAAWRVVARLSGGRHAQPLRRAMAPSPPTGPSPHAARQRRGRRSGTGLRSGGGARRYSAVVCVGRGSTKVITGLISGKAADDIRRHYGLTAVEYDTTRRRIRRSLLRHGLAWSWP